MSLVRHTAPENLFKPWHIARGSPSRHGLWGLLSLEARAWTTRRHASTGGSDVMGGRFLSRSAVRDWSCMLHGISLKTPSVSSCRLTTRLPVEQFRWQRNGDATGYHENGALPFCSWLFAACLLKPFHHDFKLCFVGGEAAGMLGPTAAGCRVVNGCRLLSRGRVSEVIFNAVSPSFRCPEKGWNEVPGTGESRHRFEGPGKLLLGCRNRVCEGSRISIAGEA